MGMQLECEEESGGVGEGMRSRNAVGMKRGVIRRTERGAAGLCTLSPTLSFSVFRLIL